MASGPRGGSSGGRGREKQYLLPECGLGPRFAETRIGQGRTTSLADHGRPGRFFQHAACAALAGFVRSRPTIRTGARLRISHAIMPARLEVISGRPLVSGRRRESCATACDQHHDRKRLLASATHRHGTVSTDGIGTRKASARRRRPSTATACPADAVRFPNPADWHGWPRLSWAPRS